MNQKDTLTHTADEIIITSGTGHAGVKHICFEACLRYYFTPLEIYRFVFSKKFKSTHIHASTPKYKFIIIMTNEINFS